MQNLNQFDIRVNHNALWMQKLIHEFREYERLRKIAPPASLSYLNALVSTEDFNRFYTNLKLIVTHDARLMTKSQLDTQHELVGLSDLWDKRLNLLKKILILTQHISTNNRQCGITYWATLRKKIPIM